MRSLLVCVALCVVLPLLGCNKDGACEMKSNAPALKNDPTVCSNLDAKTCKTDDVFTSTFHPGQTCQAIGYKRECDVSFCK